MYWLTQIYLYANISSRNESISSIAEEGLTLCGAIPQ